MQKQEILPYIKSQCTISTCNVNEKNNMLWYLHKDLYFSVTGSFFLQFYWNHIQQICSPGLIGNLPIDLHHLLGPLFGRVGGTAPVEHGKWTAFLFFRLL